MRRLVSAPRKWTRRARVALAALALLSMASAPWMARFEARALRYLDEKRGPVPPVYAGPADPNFEKFTYRSHRCWGVKDGVVCSACYNHPAHYLGQISVLCPWARTLCRYVETAHENTKYGVDMNQCIIREGTE